jgi:hypothetical protein
MKTSLLLLALLPLTALAQHSVDPFPHRDSAERIVTFFVGHEVFQRYVTLDTKRSRHLSPNAFLYHYNFSHPNFSGETFDIAFTLDSAGQFVRGERTNGLFRIPSTADSTWITARQALGICRDEGRIKKRSLRLVWDATDVSYDVFQQTHNFRDIVPGRLVWKVDGEVLFRGERYAGTFEVNVFNGTVARRFAIPWD